MEESDTAEGAPKDARTDLGKGAEVDHSTGGRGSFRGKEKTIEGSRRLGDTVKNLRKGRERSASSGSKRRWKWRLRILTLKRKKK